MQSWRRLVKDKMTGRQKGTAFVEFLKPAGARAASMPPTDRCQPQTALQHTASLTQLGACLLPGHRSQEYPGGVPEARVAIDMHPSDGVRPSAAKALFMTACCVAAALRQGAASL